MFNTESGAYTGPFFLLFCMHSTIGGELGVHQKAFSFCEYLPIGLCCSMESVASFCVIFSHIKIPKAGDDFPGLPGQFPYRVYNSKFKMILNPPFRKQQDSKIWIMKIAPSTFLGALFFGGGITQFL